MNGFVDEPYEDLSWKWNGLVSESCEDLSLNGLVGEPCEELSLNGLVDEPYADQSLNELVGDPCEDLPWNGLVGDSCEDLSLNGLVDELIGHPHGAVFDGSCGPEGWWGGRFAMVMISICLLPL